MASGLKFASLTPHAKNKGEFMDKVTITTKANTLVALKDALRKSYIEDIEVIYISEIMVNFPNVFERISESFNGDSIIIRSSRYNEDSNPIHKPGHYKNISKIDSSDEKMVYDALMETALSYVDNDSSRMEECIDEQLLVQRYSDNMEITGIVYTRDTIHNRPYYMVNYYDENDASIGTVDRMKTKFIAHNASKEFLDYKYVNLVVAIREIEECIEDVDEFEISFGIDCMDNVIIFAVKPMEGIDEIPVIMTDREFIDTKAFAKCGYLDTSHFLSDVAYWRPAELLGENPRPLDCSLYKELITNGICGDSIDRLGYAHTDDNLMQKVGNKPYISIDLSIDGFTPDSLDDKLKFKLKEYYKNRLLKNQSLHSRFEYDLVFNNYNFTTTKKLKKLLDNDFTKEEIECIAGALKEINHNVFSSYEEMTSADEKDLLMLADIRHSIRAQKPLEENNIMKLYKYIDQLANSIKQYGAPQYVRQCRCTIISKGICNSLIKGGYFSDKQIYDFIHSIPTVENEFEKAIVDYAYGKIKKEEFDEKYGHLRLKPYDIRTDCYKHMEFEGIMSEVEEHSYDSKKYDFSLDKTILTKAIEDADFELNADELIDFITKTVVNKAYFKSEFTKTLSLILDIIAVMGDLHGIAREDMSYLEIQDLISYHSRDSYIQIIEARRDMYHAYTCLVLPDVIFNVGDIDIIDFEEELD